MSKFYFGLVNDLRRSLFIVASSQVQIPVFIDMSIDFTLLDTNKRKSIEVRRYAESWKRKVLDFLISALGNDDFKRFEFIFSHEDNQNQGHSIKADINIKLANERIIEQNERKREENRIKHNQQSLKELQSAYLNQDVNNNDFEQGSRLPSIED